MTTRKPDPMAPAIQGRVAREVIRNYSYVVLWMSISISVGIRSIFQTELALRGHEHLSLVP